MNTRTWLWLSIVTASAAWPHAASATTVQADPSTYVHALATLQPGDTLQLAVGTYPGLAITGVNGTASQWITITGPADDPTAAVIQAPADGCCDVVELVNTSYLAIENVEVDGNHVPNAFGISAKGDTGNAVHDIRIDGCTIVNVDNDGDPADLGQQDDGISTKTPTWGWIIRRNTIIGAGTGMYLGNSDGTDPFVAGVIEDNLIENPTGYCIEIKFQVAWPSGAGLPSDPTSTIVRNNVFIKNDHAATTSGGRPQLLVGGFPASGAGSQNRYEIYGNLFDHDSDDSLLQASGRVTIHDNIFVDAPGQRAVELRDQDEPLELAYVYDNTIYGMPEGVVFGNSAPQGDAVFGNLVLTGTGSGTQITGPIAILHDNITDVQSAAASYVAMPSTTLGAMSLYPLPGAATGPAVDASAVAQDTDYAIDFDCATRGSFTQRGAYAGGGVGPHWMLAAAIKDVSGCGSAGSDGSVGSDGSDGGDGSNAGDGGTHAGGCCDTGGGGGGSTVLAAVVLAMIARRRGGG